MELRILGPLEVADDGREVELVGARQRALLAILLLHRNEVVPAERLLEHLYGAEQPATAAKSLQAHVSRLRKVLAPDRLLTRGSGYVLVTEPEEVDAERFVRLLDSGRAALADGDAAAGERCLLEALALWRGSPLDDVAYEEFAQSEVARLEELRLGCVEELNEARLALGRHAELVGELERLVAAEPLRERRSGQLMVALYRCGRQAEALAAYADARRILNDELGLAPSRALQELERAILNQDPSLDLAVQTASASVDGIPSAGRLAAGTFVGRRDELSLLADALSDARAGRGRLALLSGEAGIGKSRLADELAALAKQLGMTVLWGRCWEAGGAPAYWPWVQALRSLVRNGDTGALRARLGRGAPEVAHLLPELRELYPDLDEPPELDSEGARFRLFDATAAFLRNVAADRPLLVVLDDVHSADASSLLMLEFVSAELADARVLLLGVYRDPELDPGDPIVGALASVARHASMRITLGGLHGPEVETFIEASSHVEPHPSLVAAIAAETEGNPLFVGEIVRMLAGEGRLTEPADASWRVTIPETVKEVIGRRLHRLTSECSETLAVASVVGREFPLDLAERLTDHPGEDLLVLLDEAVTARLVTDVPGSPGRLRFTHALVRDTLYDALPQARRVDLHRRAGEAIEALAGADVSPYLSELAHHYFRALPGANPLLAVDYIRRAAQQATALLAHEEAARLYSTAVQALELRPGAEPELQRRVLLELGESLNRSGDIPNAHDAFLQAASLARATGAADDLARAALGYGGRIVWARAARDRLVVPLLEEALAAVGDEPTTLRARLLARLAGALRDERDPTRRVATAELAVATARTTKDPWTLVYALAGLCGARHGIGDENERLAIAAELRAAARSVGDKEHEFDANTAEALVYLDRGAMTEARERIAMASALADEIKQPSHQWFAATNHALLALHEGRFEEAERIAEEGIETGRRAAPGDIAEGTYCLQLYEVRRQQGRSADVNELVAQTARDYPGRPVFRCAHARLAFALGRHSEARELFEELASNDFAVVPRDNEWTLAAHYLTETCRALRDTVRAAALYDLLVPSADKIVSDVAEGCAGSVQRLLGILAGMLGREDDAVAHLRTAIERNTAVGARPWLAEAQVELAELLLGRGDAVEAELLLGDASAIAAKLSMVPLAARIQALRPGPA
jgi:DNA-binding SARP family transcriptional activator